MKKHGILNSTIAKVLADLGHTDTIVIADVGLPIPDGVAKIDLALTFGSPSFEETVNAILEDMVVEKVVLAEEIQEANKATLRYINHTFADTIQEYCSHEQFKQLTHQAKVIIRTGEATPYANIILQAGVNFGN